jgi:hypothetical protein
MLIVVSGCLRLPEPGLQDGGTELVETQQDAVVQDVVPVRCSERAKQGFDRLRRPEVGEKTDRVDRRPPSARGILECEAFILEDGDERLNGGLAESDDTLPQLAR